MSKKGDHRKGKGDDTGKSSKPDRRRNTPPDTPAETPPAKKRKPAPKPSKKAAAATPKPKRGRGRPTAEELANRCTATSKTSGERCRQAAIPGGRVCRYHGGGAPQVQRSARGRLAELVMPAIETLNHEREHAKRSADRQRAANSILDRAGITRGHSAEIDAARALLLERLLTLRAENAGELDAAPDPLELIAEVVDEEDDDEAEYGDEEERGDSGS